MRLSPVSLNAARRGAAFLVAVKAKPDFDYHRRTGVSTSANREAGSGAAIPLDCGWTVS
jgi:hypothetical protein